RRLVRGLGGEPITDLGRHVLERLLSPRTRLEHLDRVKAERGAYGLGRELTTAEREGDGLERRHHLALRDPAEVAALGLAARILGELGGELAEVLAGFGATDDIGHLRARLVLGLAAAGLRHP